MIANEKEIRDNANLLNVVGQYVDLKRRGANHVGCCPFHDENTPSFTVFPASGRYKCFGCGEGGDAITFLMDFKNMTYPEALESAAADSRIEVQYTKSEKRQEELDLAKRQKARADQLAETIQTIHQYYCDQNPLPVYCDLATRIETVDADGRELRRETAETFGMCYAPTENIVARSGFWDADRTYEIGIVGKGKEGFGDYDFFRNRMLFRIRDHRGKIVGIAGRRRRADDKLTGDKAKSKFINPRESVLYHKNEVLFGLWENRKGIRESGHAVLVEGYMDVITPHDHGICNHVATCGTALTDQQAALLSRYTDEVLVMRDADEAGQTAAKRDVEILLRHGLKVRVCLLGAGNETIAAEIATQEKWVAEKAQEIAERETRVREKFEMRRLKAEAKGATLEEANEPPDHIIVREKRLLEAMEEKLSALQSKAEAQATLKDADDFCRKQGRAALLKYIEENTEDAVLWRVMVDVTDKTDIYQKESATHVAAGLLSLIESETLREYYVRELCKTDNLGPVKRVLTDTIETYSRTKGKRSDLTPKQKQDVLSYGFYERDNQYFISSDVSGEGWGISNFILRPIVFIEGQRESIRLVEIANAENEKRVLDINAKNFVELGPFKTAVEGRGNFLFEGKPEHFGKIKRKIYKEMRTAFPIYTLGLHKEGFWTFANGIVADGKFHPVDEYGIVAHGDTRYYLPACSKIREHIKSDDVANDFEDELYYQYTASGKGVSWKEWTAQMMSVYPDHAISGILYLCSTFIREKIYERLDNMFPHLNLFGQPSSGKNQFAASLCAIFGKYRPPVHIVNATDAAFFRRIAQVRNGLAWYDEYMNDIDHRRIEALKQFADGTGRARATVDNPNRTTSSAVVSGCIVSGQHQPTADVALFTRCISLSFTKTEFSDIERERHGKLKAIGNSGELTDFVPMLHSHRAHLREGFPQEFEQAFARMLDLLKGHNIMDRIVRSYAAMLTTYRLLKDRIEFAFTEAQVESHLINCIIAQKDAVFQENEVSIFWRFIEFLLANGEVEHGADIIVEEQGLETYDLDWKGEKRDTKQYAPARRLVYLSFARTHPLYMDRHQRQRNKKGLDLEALKHYLKNAPGFEGFKRAKKFTSGTRTAFVFDAARLPFDIEDTVVALAKKRQFAAPEAEAPAPISEPTSYKATKNETPVDQEMPF